MIFILFFIAFSYAKEHKFAMSKNATIYDSYIIYRLEDPLQMYEGFDIMVQNYKTRVDYSMIKFINNKQVKQMVSGNSANIYQYVEDPYAKPVEAINITTSQIPPNVAYRRYGPVPCHEIDKWYEVEIFPSTCVKYIEKNATGHNVTVYSSYIVKNKRIWWYIFEDSNCTKSLDKFNGEQAFAWIGDCDKCEADHLTQAEVKAGDKRIYYQHYYCERYNGSSLLSILLLITLLMVFI